MLQPQQEKLLRMPRMTGVAPKPSVTQCGKPLNARARRSVSRSGMWIRL